ncbi:hypothetical protein BD769DRAFT_1395924 [Suillus cothurnatus]|nr:hypothetical protein BD769DRAFT_1395924 [Suillus cothurnatus]
MSAPLNPCEPRNVKKKGYGKCRKVTRQASPDPPSPVVKPVKAKKISTGKVPCTKTVPPLPDATIQTTCSDSSVKNGLSSKLKHQCTFADDSEEDSNESDKNVDLQPEKSPALFESDDDQPEGDSVTNGNYSDTDHEESEGEEPEATAMMLSDEVPLLTISNTHVSLKSKQSHGKTQSARDAKQAAESLLTVAGNRHGGIRAIKECLQVDAQYAAHLTSLVEPRIPLLHCYLKVAACTNIDSYFCLGNNMIKAKKLVEQHAYIYALRFDGVFTGAKSIGVKFAECFVELANNKGNRPEMPIPLLALMATAVWSFLPNFALYSLVFKVYAALFWKMLGSPGKFNFTGNQFSKTYVFHVKFLKDLKRDAPGKFHCMMADIYEAVQTLKQKGNNHFTNEHQDMLGLLDLDGMAED